MEHGFETNDIYRDSSFNPMMQYEQGYAYYRYLCMQMEYKIKCKQYENLCNERPISSNHSNMSQGRSA